MTYRGDGSGPEHRHLMHSEFPYERLASMIEHKAERESLPVIHLIVNQSKDGEQMAGSQILSTGS